MRAPPSKDVVELAAHAAMMTISKRRDLFVTFSTFGFGLVMFVLTTIIVGTLMTGILDTGERPRLSITAIFVGLAVVVLLPYVLMERASEGRAPIVAAIAALGWFPVLFAIGDYELGNAIIDGPESSGSHLGVAAVVVIGLPIAAAIAAPSMASLVRSGNALRVIAPIAWLVGAIVVAVAAVRVTRLPDPDTYGATFPLERTVRVHEDFTLDATPVRFTDPSIDYNRCFFEVRDMSSRRLTTDTLPCTDVDLLRDDANGYWIIRQRHSRRGGSAALRFGSLEQLTVFPRTIAKSVAPPIGWVIGAAVGLLFALVALVSAIAFRRGGLAMRAAGANLGALVITSLACATLLASATHVLIR